MLSHGPIHVCSTSSSLHYGLHLDLRCVYELDSSTREKFSRHLTVRLPSHAFANNHAMGKFVAQVRGASGHSWPLVHEQKHVLATCAVPLSTASIMHALFGRCWQPAAIT